MKDTHNATESRQRLELALWAIFAVVALVYTYML